MSFLFYAFFPGKRCQKPRDRALVQTGQAGNLTDRQDRGFNGEAGEDVNRLFNGFNRGLIIERDVPYAGSCNIIA